MYRPNVQIWQRARHGSRVIVLHLTPHQVIKSVKHFSSGFYSIIHGFDVVGNWTGRPICKKYPVLANLKGFALADHFMGDAAYLEKNGQIQQNRKRCWQQQ